LIIIVGKTNDKDKTPTTKTAVRVDTKEEKYFMLGETAQI
jgi:hypothetical protein